MRICVLQASYERSASPLKDHDPPAAPSRFAPEHEWTSVMLHKATASRDVALLARAGYDAFFNVCDGAWDEDRAGIEVVHALERAGVPFTGPRADFYDPSRLEMKLAAAYAGVKIPAFAFVHRAEDIAAAAALRFPLIVKHPASYGSIGLTARSRVTCFSELESEASRFVAEYGGALVEEFVAGREFTVLVTEPRAGEREPWVLAPFECDLGSADAFKHFDLKWKDYGTMRWSAVSEPALRAALDAAARAVFVGLRGSGYGRCDFRLDPSGELYFLEINPLCGLFYPDGAFGSGDFILEAEPGGHAAFVRHLLDRAFVRHAARPGLSVRHSRAHGFGVHAARRFARGERIEILEERARHLVSRAHVEREWTGKKRLWFGEYAYPLTDRTYAMWSERPSDWRPYNHSCDPNAELRGLDVVARRDVAEGEAVALDYATFTGPETAPFACACGAAACRREVTGWDHLTDAVVPYGDALSDYVASARGELARLGACVRPARAGGFELAAARPRARGEVLAAFDRILARRGRHTLQVGRDEHVLIVPAALRLLGHACRPNARVDLTAARVELVEDVAPGDPLTLFYPATEWELAEPFECRCGAPDCLGWVRGARHTPAARLLSHAPAAHVRALLG